MESLRPGMPGSYGVVEDEVGGIGKVHGRHVCRPYGVVGDL